MMRTLATTVLLTLMVATLGFCQGEQPPEDGVDEDRGQVVVLRAVWPDGDLTNTSFRIFADREMRVPMEVLPAPDGEAMIVLQPGEYYAMAVVDVNANNAVDAGDAFGFHGVADLDAASQPAPLRVEEGRANFATINILMVLGEDGRLVPLPSAVERTPGTLRGDFEKGEGAHDSRTRLLVLMPTTEGARPTAHVIGPYEFELRVPPGAYQIAILVDEDRDGTLSTGDPVALLGFGDDEPVSIGPGGTTEIGPLRLAPADPIPDGIPPLVAGAITAAQIPEGGQASVAFCTDAALREEAFSVVADSAGRFAAAVAPGTYYLRVTIDREADGALGPGDMLGFFGVDELLGDEQPAPLVVAEGALRTDIAIPISARLDDDGRLTAYTGDEDAANNEPANAGE